MAFTPQQQALFDAHGHLPWVIVRAIKRRLPKKVAVELLMGAALRGLMEAAISFDPSRGVLFRTYCVQRIRGSVFDEMRQMEWFGRSGSSGRSPAVATNAPQERTSTGSRGDSHDDPPAWWDFADAVRPATGAGATAAPVDHAEHRDTVAYLLRRLNHKDAELLRAYYLDQPTRTQSEIAASRGVTESSVCQDLKRIRQRCLDLLKLQEAPKVRLPNPVPITRRPQPLTAQSRLRWTPAMEALLGTMSDQQLADRLGTTRKRVRHRREKLRISSFKSGKSKVL